MKVNEIFQSISGEVGNIPQGAITWFIRFQGCNLECNWCFGILPGGRIPKLMLSKGAKVDLDKCRVGDTVLTYDEQFNIVETTVVKTHVREVDSWLQITIDGTQYFVTHEHPFMTPKGITKASDLSVGDAIYEVKPNQLISYKKLEDRRDGKQLQIAIGNNGKRVEAIKEFIRADIYPSVRPKPLKVYNLTCSPHNTFFLDNMWVHNCDTERAQNPDEYSVSLSPEEIAAAIPAYSNVVLTGGEPLLQNKEELHWLVSILDDKGCIIQVETNGSQKPFLPIICHIFDYKTPSSGMQDKMMPFRCFLECSGFSQTWIKFVIKNLEDLEFTISILKYFDWLRPGWNGLQIALSIDSGEGVQNAMNRLKETFPIMMHKIVFNFQLHKHFNLK